MRQLPTGWTIAPLSDIGDWGSGGTPKRTNPAFFDGGTIPWLVIGDLTDGVVTVAANHITELGLANSSAKRLPVETLLVAMYGSIGKLGITGIECATNQAIAFCRPNAAAELRYLFYALMNAKSDLVAQGQGGAQQNISQTVLKAHRVPMAPRSEQKRIADKLDAVLAKVDASRERLNRVPAILKKFRQAVLEAAVSGRLTEEWRAIRGDEARDDWRDSRLEAVCEPKRVITYGVIKLGADAPAGVPCLRTSNVRWLRVDEDGMRRIAPQLSNEYGRTVLTGSEVLVNVRGTLGGVAAVQQHMVGWNVSREVAVVPVAREQVHPRFLALWIASNSNQRWLRGVQKGVAYTGINIEDLRALPVRVPSLAEQVEIVRRVDELFALADGLERKHRAAVSRIEKLTPAVLAKAFRGELVPQDPDDEPASVLLERIRRERTMKPERRSGSRVSAEPAIRRAAMAKSGSMAKRGLGRPD